MFLSSYLPDSSYIKYCSNSLLFVYICLFASQICETNENIYENYHTFKMILLLI